MSKEKRLVKNTLIIGLANICTKCIGFFMMPLYTSLLTTFEYGIVDVISTYASLLTVVLTLQLEQGLFRYLIKSRNNRTEQTEYISVALMLIAVAIAVFVLATVPVLSAIRYQYTLFFVLITATNVVNALFLQLPRGMGDNKKYAMASCLNGSSVVILNVLFIAVWKLGIRGLCLASVLSNVLSIIYVFVTSRVWRYVDFRAVSASARRTLMSFSAPLIPYTLTWWLISASDRIIINAVLGAAFNGIYAIANKFPSIYTLVSNIFQQAWAEAVIENAGEKECDEFYNNIVNKAIRFYSACCLGAIAILPFVFDFLVNERYKEAYLYIPILTTAAMFHAIAALYGAIYLAFNRTKKLLVSNLMAAIINILVNVLWINQIGLFAAAISTVISQFVILLERCIETKEFLKISVQKRFVIYGSVAWVFVLWGYYTGTKAMQMLILSGVILYSIYSNHDTLLELIKSMRSKLGRR